MYKLCIYKLFQSALGVKHFALWKLHLWIWEQTIFLKMLKILSQWPYGIQGTRGVDNILFKIESKMLWFHNLFASYKKYYLWIIKFNASKTIKFLKYLINLSFRKIIVYHNINHEFFLYQNLILRRFIYIRTSHLKLDSILRNFVKKFTNIPSLQERPELWWLRFWILT